MGLIIERKKEEKRQNLLDAAYSVFLEKGVSNTSISDIVSKANVAKGTFYLYFKDKVDVLQALTYKLSYEILLEAYTSITQNDTGDFTENVIIFVDYIIEYFKKEPEVLQVLERNFSWPLVEEKWHDSSDPLVQSIIASLKDSPVLKSKTEYEVFRLIFIIVEMCGSICYSSIIEKKPDSIDNLKPTLYEIIRKILA